MFAGLITQLQNDLNDVRTVVEWHEKLRSTLTVQVGTPAPLTLEPASAEELRSQAPNKLPWQIFDHCAAISRLYALFERSIEDLVEKYLGYMPRVFPGYGSLAEKLRLQHRTGVGQILTKWNTTHSIFGSINESEIAAGLADGLRAKPYSLLADAFLLDPENLRANALTRLFNGLGFENCFAWVRRFPPVADFCAAKLSGAATADSFLDEFVRARNEAAHGNLANIAGAALIGDYCQYISLVVEALAALLRSDLVKSGVRSNCTVNVGEVVHAWSQNIVGVRSCCTESISVGDRLYAGRKLIEPVTIQSLRIGSADHPTLLLRDGLEFGVRFDKSVHAGSRLYRWKI